MKEKISATSIDEYINQCPAELRETLHKIRDVIKAAAPTAEERISYGMPGFYLKGSLVWFAPNKDSLGFYPTGSGIAAFKQELAGYKSSKGAVQFPLDQPIPYDLITRMVQFKVAENQGKKTNK